MPPSARIVVYRTAGVVMKVNERERQPENRDQATTFGARIRELRYQRGIGIKRLAPELGVDYSYLSRVENEKVIPSASLIERLSDYFGQDKDELMLLAEKVPKDVMRILREHPQETLALLRSSFIGDDKQP